MPTETDPRYPIVLERTGRQINSLLQDMSHLYDAMVATNDKANMLETLLPNCRAEWDAGLLDTDGLLSALYDAHSARHKAARAEFDFYAMEAQIEYLREVEAVLQAGFP
jgi:hypothetical protein